MMQSLFFFLLDDTKNNHNHPLSSGDGRPSPTIFEKLREISNSLRLASSKPINVSTPVDLSCKTQATLDSVEPETPRATIYLGLDGDSKYKEIATPQDILKARSTGLKVT